MLYQQLPMAPYAVPHLGTLGRTHQEPEDTTRLPFQRDRGRIVHTQAFRRLKGKTQVFVVTKSDHYRTRLTHTLEVTGISRDIARNLGLNEDLAECIALAHDLGHPPFGHAGEEALNEWMQKHGLKFEHNEQSLRIVTLLEEHSSKYSGLNVSIEILEGLMKHRTPHDNPTDTIPRAPSLEAQLVNMADEIAYTAHDCEDGLNAGLFALDELTGSSLAAAADEKRSERGTSLRGAIINALVTDLHEETDRRLKKYDIATLDDVYDSSELLVCFSSDMRKQLDELRSFLWQNMYQHPAVLSESTKGQQMLTALCDHYENNPNTKIIELQEETNGALTVAIKDYLAGMTDGYCAQIYSEL